MDTWWMASMLGGTTGALIWAAGRFPALAWFALVPLGVAVQQMSEVHAALAGASAGVVGSVGVVWTRTLRALLPLVAGANALGWGLGFGLAAWLTSDAAPAWIVLALPLASVVGSLPLRLAGAPRWVTENLACSQEPWLPVVHTARLGGTWVTTVLLAIASSVIVMLAAEPVPRASSAFALGMAVMVVGAGLTYGFASFRAAVGRAEAGVRVRVAAVVVDGADPQGVDASGMWPLVSPEYRDVETTIRRYAPYIHQAAAAGARVLVLPEVTVCVNGPGTSAHGPTRVDSRARWLDAVACWAKTERVAIVAPFYDMSAGQNELVLVDTDGASVGNYEKQHPAPIEGERHGRMSPGPFYVHAPDALLPVSTVICVDLDYHDLVAPVRNGGGLLAAPANDWRTLAELHHRTAVWAAVLSGVPVVRATGHGISSVFDGAGRLVACASSFDGPVVLIADLPLATPV